MSTLIKSNNKWLKVAGGGVLPVVRKPAWSQAVAISAADLVAGYVAPSDGMIVGCIRPVSGAATSIEIKVNNVTVSRGGEFPNSGWDGCVQVQVNKNDSMTTGRVVGCILSFVPFEDSTVAEPEVVTPEYIRNQNILSDWEDITVPAAGFTAPYDGFVSISNSVATGKTGLAAILVNGVSCNSWRILPTDTTVGANTLACSAPIKKGDVVTVIGVDIGATKARYYKLRDYRGR